MQKLDNSKTKSVDWQKLVAFRETFEKKSFSAGRWVEEEGYFPFFSYSRSAKMFIETVYEAGIIEKFDWGKWQSKAERLVLDPKALKSASLGTLRKLITTHVRKDRFCE